MALQFANNISTRLSAGIGTGDLTITVDDASGFPVLSPSDPAYITIADVTETYYEICLCTNITGNQLTIARGRDGTVASTFFAGAFVQMRITAAVLQEMVQRPELAAKSDVGHTHLEADITDLDKYTQAEVDAADALKVSKAGDTMTGHLNIVGYNEAFITLRDTNVAGWANIIFYDSNTRPRARVLWDNGQQTFLIRYFDNTGAQATDLTFTNDGNVSVDGAAPTADENLTRKDYVDTLVFSQRKSLGF